MLRLNGCAGRPCLLTWHDLVKKTAIKTRVKPGLSKNTTKASKHSHRPACVYLWKELRSEGEKLAMDSADNHQQIFAVIRNGADEVTSEHIAAANLNSSFFPLADILTEAEEIVFNISKADLADNDKFRGGPFPMPILRCSVTHSYAQLSLARLPASDAHLEGKNMLVRP